MIYSSYEAPERVRKRVTRPPMVPLAWFACEAPAGARLEPRDGAGAPKGDC